MSPTAAAVSLTQAVAAKRVVLCLGSGGVGKTTASAALAVALAARGERVVVLTIDPARRLADALGRGGSLGNEPTRVDLPLPVPAGRRRPQGGQVWAAMLDPAETFEGVVRAEAADPAQAERILANRLFTNLVTALSGTNEYMAGERLHQLLEDGRFDRVVVDTPPSRHAFDFLDSPGRLTRFVDHRLYRSVFANRSRLLRPLNAGARIVMGLLARLVGSSLVDDVVAFFADFEGLDQGFRRRAEEIERLLSGPDTAYVLITAPRRDRLDEADWILGNLARRHRRLDAVVVNRVLPIDGDAAAQALAGGGLAAPLAANLADLATLATQERAVLDDIRATVAERLDRAPGSVPLITVAEQLRPVRDAAGLADLAALL